MNTALLPFASLEYHEPIVNLTLSDNVEIGFPEIQAITKKSEELSGFRPYFLLVNLGKNVRLTTEGKKTAINPTEHPLRRGSAVMVKSEAEEKSAGFFTEAPNRLAPRRSFTDRSEAIKWLLSLPLN